MNGLPMKNNLQRLFSYCCISIAVVSYWRGTWAFSDAYIYPNDRETSAWISCLIGYGGIAFFAIVQILLSQQTNLTSASLNSSSSSQSSPAISSAANSNSLRAYVVNWFYIYCLGFLGISCWRGVWILEELYFTNSDRGIWISHFFGAAALTAFGHLQTSLAAPVAVISDNAEDAIRNFQFLRPVICQPLGYDRERAGAGSPKTA